MRLLNSTSRQLELLHGRSVRYAILSHRWGDESEEVLFKDIGVQANAERKRKGYEKILGSCSQAKQDGLDYVWLDTCCIDKNNSSELQEAINSMYKWYQRLEVCYAYLHDVSDLSEFIKSDWFTRGWTLQELIAPRSLKFFTKDWAFIGTREDLVDPIAELTGINREILRTATIPPEVTISQKMFWASKRETTRVEDKAYSMLGILRVDMDLRYGTDDAAFENLHHSIIAKYSDQTLFAWYRTHTVTQSDDVEMAQANSASDLAPDPTPELVEGDTSTTSYTPTGLFASSPHQYMVSYEISESEFRKNYVDDIREYSYRSHFSISNNLVHITLPVKHVRGKIWKAVLRCSFEPPDGDEPQRPLVIYLEEIQPWKYLRAHLAPNEVEQEGDDQMHDVAGIPGSLERLGDAESKLKGYVLRNIDIIGRHEESCSGDQSRPSPRDPGAPSERTEAQRIAELPRHPSGVKTTNVIVCGEPGAAAGRVINLIVGDTVIKPLTDYERETMSVTIIDTTLQSKNIRIFYIIGPRDRCLDINIYNVTIQNMYQLVQQVKKAEGIHIVLLCMVGSRVTEAVESNYRLFHDYICGQQVPMNLIITGLGKTKRMEDWWDKHRADRELQAMCFLNHACITVLQGEDEEHEKRYRDSAQMIQGLLVDFMKGLETTPRVYCPDDAHRWFAYMGGRAMELLWPDLKKSFKREAVAKTLKEVIQLNEAEATSLAGQFFDEHAMEL